MEYPHIQFRLNKSLDKKMVIEFLDFTTGGINFGKGILNIHPEIKRSIFGYIDFFYKRNNKILKRSADNFRKKWKTKEKLFFEVISKIFRNHPWPKGKYIGYISIFDCNPRFLQDKTFQIFYKHKTGPIYITVHELLHFIFYDYVNKKRKDLRKKLSEDDFWRLSEIVNEILLNSPSFKKIINNQKKINGYPEFKKNVSCVKHKIKKITEIDKIGILIDTVIKLL